MLRIAEAPCRKCGTPKRAMLNSRNAPVLGCPTCAGLVEEKQPPPIPTPEPLPLPAPEPQPRRPWGTFLHFATETD